MRSKICRSQRGFTLVEMLTVLVILGVLMSISIVTFTKAKQRSKLARVKTNVSEIILALDDFARDHQGKYPAFTDFHNVDSPGYDTSPVPPGDPAVGVPQIVKRRGNAIILVGVMGQQVRDVIRTVGEHCCARQEAASPKVEIGAGTVFVLDVVHFEKM